MVAPWKPKATIWFLALYQTNQTLTVCEVGRLLVQVTQAPMLPCCVHCCGEPVPDAGAVNDWFGGTVTCTLSDTAVAALPAKSLVFNVTLHVPDPKPLMFTV